MSNTGSESFVERLKKQAEKPVQNDMHHTILHDIARDIEVDNTDATFIVRIDSGNRNNLESIAFSQYFAPAKESARYAHPAGNTSLSDPLKENVSTLYIRINPDSRTLSGLPHIIPRPRSDCPTKRAHELDARYAAPLAAWMLREGAKHFHIGLRLIDCNQPATPQSAVLRISIDRSDIAAQLCLGKIAHYINSYEPTPYNATPDGGMRR